MNEDRNLHPPGLARLSLWNKRQIKEQAPRSRCGHFLPLRMGPKPLRAGWSPPEGPWPRGWGRDSPLVGAGLAAGGRAGSPDHAPRGPARWEAPPRPSAGQGARPAGFAPTLLLRSPGREARRSGGRREERREEGGAERAQRRAQSPMSRAEPAPLRTPARCSPSPRPTWCQVR